MGKGPSYDPYAAAGAQSNLNQQTGQWNTWSQNADVNSPFGSSKFTQSGWQPIYDNKGQISGYAPRYQQDISLSPQEQSLYDKNTTLRGTLADTANAQAGRISKLLSTNMTATGLSPWKAAAAPGAVRQDQAPTDRAAIERAMMQRYHEYADPANQAEQAQMAARGLAPGAQGYGQMEKGQQDALSRATRDAYLASGDEARQAQNAYNAAGLQKYQMGADWASQLNNLRQAQFTERTMLRDQPIKEISTLLGLGAPNTPQFSPFQGTQISTPNLEQDIMNKYNIDKQNQSDMLSGGFGIGKALVGAMPWASWLSDRRVKDHVRRQPGELAGCPIYSFTYKKCSVVPQKLWGARRVGVMADEVEKIHPDAVVHMPDGYARVNYELLHERHAHG
jgi:hypothetical protein